jgi:hypothetical protein
MSAPGAGWISENYSDVLVWAILDDPALFNYQRRPDSAPGVNWQRVFNDILLELSQTERDYYSRVSVKA